MSRTSRKEVDAVFERLCNIVGVTPFIDHRGVDHEQSGPRATRYRHDGDSLHHNAGWSLDHNPTYGGYVIRGHSGEGTGESEPMGSSRMPTGEFVRAMHFAIRAIDAVREAARS